ncbi:MAG: cell well associated RhsD protein [Flaviaesturariibacter sp.]|nr:cell well associated RhsD protein [Flaviaesturariibacter sp.]
MGLVGRKYSAGNSYRYGFNGKENDNEVKGEGGQQDYGLRIYDPRLGKFLSVDPLTKKFPFLTPYQFASNTPIQSIDLDGAEAQNVITGEIDNQLNPRTVGEFKGNKKSLSPWSDLLLQGNSSSEIKSANERFVLHEFKDQKLSHASGNLLNRDYYSVKIDQLPKNFNSPGDFFSFVRVNLNHFMKGGGNSFEPYDGGEDALWKSANPLSSIMRFKGRVGGYNIDDADVVTSNYSYSDKAAYWVFKPVTDISFLSLGSPSLAGDANHPLAGYRQFGIAPNQENGSTFYVRGVDRAWGIGDALLQNVVFNSADILWNIVMKNIANYINTNGGKAIVSDPISDRVNWFKLKSSEKQKIIDAGN